MTRFALGLPACGLGVVLALGGAGCGHSGMPDATTMRVGEMGGSSYLSEDAAVKALVDAAREAEGGDRGALREVLGGESDQLTSGDPVEDRNEIKSFLKHMSERNRIESRGGMAMLYLGADDFPFPIPLVNKQGKWKFDTKGGISKILARRIGRDELSAIQFCREYVEAQREYASRDRDGDEVLEYAPHIHSREGKRDGLYWEAAAGEEQSPLGPLAAQAAEEGYVPVKGAPKSPLHGYYFHSLHGQGKAAPGGAYGYTINGNQIGGFALVAWPAKYGASGIMTFIVSQNGKVYQKDLGEKTDSVARKVDSYDPDSSWTLVQD